MSDIKVEIDEFVPPTAKEIEAMVDAEIQTFEDFFKTLGNDGLMRAERAILKTYFAYRLLRK